MVSVAEGLGLNEDQMRSRVLSLVAYARSNREIEFPRRGLDEVEGGLPLTLPPDLLSVEAATAMAGAANAALVVDQRIGLRLAYEAAELYSQAGFPYSAFLLAGLSGTIEDRWRNIATGIVEPERRQGAQLALDPRQLGYLTLALHIVGDEGAPRLAERLPGPAGLGSLDVPFSLVRATVSAYGPQQAALPWRPVLDYVMAGFERVARSRVEWPRYKRMLPWNVGLPLDAVLLALVASNPDPAVIGTTVVGPYSSALATAADGLRSDTESSTVLRNEPLEETLADWIASQNRG